MLLYVLFFGVLGLVFGSFLNVVIWRVPRGESIVSPGSHCPECGHILRFWELIPVISFLLLKGKCSRCGLKISLRYPAVEILTGLLFVLVYLFRTERNMIGIILDLAFVAFLIALAFIDIATFRLPDVLVLGIVLIGLINPLLTKDPLFWLSLLGAGTAGGVFTLIAYFYPEGMGWGDVKFVAALGLYLGVPGIFSAVFFASLLGVIIGGLRIIVYKKDFKDPIPFGPFLAGGAVIVLLFGSKLRDILFFLT
ncbi:MAG TPA: prepilin peptidase [Peptococcaceae bacterium]|nr:prepilin peptidase [Peptococcaceae bacterium]